jgi:membrane-associated phospholipid phosphatase
VTGPVVDRYAADPSPPTHRQVGRDLARRVLGPAAGLWVVVAGTGVLIVGPLGDPTAEDDVVRAMAQDRTPWLDTATSLWSNVGATEFILLACVAAIALLWWRTKQWWLAVVPGIAVAVQAAVFVTAAAVVGRTRPEADQLDTAPPTSSFPSGHVGASTAFYVTLAVLSRRIPDPTLRWLATTACLLVPALVAYARLYRGMHHPTDVVVGVVNGLACAWLAWHYLRRERRGPRTAHARR